MHLINSFTIKWIIFRKHARQLQTNWVVHSNIHLPSWVFILEFEINRFTNSNTPPLFLIFIFLKNKFLISHLQNTHLPILVFIDPYQNFIRHIGSAILNVNELWWIRKMYRELYKPTKVYFTSHLMIMVCFLIYYFSSSNKIAYFKISFFKLYIY